MAFNAAIIIVLMSFFPLYTGSTIAFDDTLVGKWGVENSQVSWEFSEMDSGDGYYVVYTDPIGVESQFTAYLVDLDGNMFLDLYSDPGANFDMSLLYSTGLFPMHTFMYVREIGSTMELCGFNGTWVSDYLQTNPGAVDHVANDEGLIMLTAPSEELQDFLLEIVENEDAFLESETFSRMNTEVMQ